MTVNGKTAHINLAQKQATDKGRNGLNLKKRKKHDKISGRKAQSNLIPSFFICRAKTPPS